METVAIDLGDACVDVCRWDGTRLTAAKWPSDDPAQAAGGWLRDIGSSIGSGLHVLFRSTRDRPDRDAASLQRIAGALGAKSVRIAARNAICDPPVAAAWQVAHGDSTGRAANRIRAGSAIFLEVGAAHAAVARVDRRGRIIARKETSRFTGEPVDISSVAEMIRAVGPAGETLRKDDSPAESIVLVAFGGAGPALAASAATACDIERVLIPDGAGVLGAIGLLLADTVIEVREDLPGRAFDLPGLRAAFGRLMDEACRAIQREGRDLDDAECDRLAEMGRADDPRCVIVACEALSDAERLRNEFERTWQRHTAGRASMGGPPVVHSAIVRAAIESPRPSLPSPSPPADEPRPPALEFVRRCTGSGGATSERFGPIYDRRRLLHGESVRGPCLIQDAWHVIAVPDGWGAEDVSGVGVMIHRG